MQRWHLFELEDQSWVPRPIRDGGRDVLDWMFAKMKMYRPVVDRLTATLDATNQRTVVDVCSGGGGGALQMFDELRARGDRRTEMVLTDRFPNEAAAERVAARADAGIRYHPAPVDAFAMPAELGGVRTMYSALHHFRPQGVKQLIASAVAAKAPLAFFDAAASAGMRRVPGFLVPLVMIPNFVILFVLTLFMVPWVRPVRASRLLFTYLLPLIPILYAWDGTVSALRAYSPEEVLAIAREVPGAGDYVWDAGRVKDGPIAVLYLTGRPR